MSRDLQAMAVELRAWWDGLSASERDAVEVAARRRRWSGGDLRNRDDVYRWRDLGYPWALADALAAHETFALGFLDYGADVALAVEPLYAAGRPPPACVEPPSAEEEAEVRVPF